MALSIIESCVNCWACAPLCPSKAIYEARPHFMIDAKKCTECDGDYSDTQCASICPIEGAITVPGIHTHVFGIDENVFVFSVLSLVMARLMAESS